MHARALLLAILAVPLSALAHEGATGLVRERMELMKDIGEATKTLGGMARAGAPDAAVIDAAARRLVAAAAAVPEAFETRDLTPPTEARAEIWAQWPDFVERSEAMARAARQLPAAADDPDAFRRAFADLGRSCAGCHERYRIETGQTRGTSRPGATAPRPRPRQPAGAHAQPQ